MKYKLLCMIVLFSLLGSCAPRQDVKPQEPEQLLPPPPEELTLPDIAPEIEPPAEEEDQMVEAPVVEKKAEEQYIMLNFENADLETVINTIGEMLNINYILSPGISGKITIQSHQKVPLSELFSIFQTMLEFNGFTAIKDGSFYRIVPIDSARQQPVPVEAGKKAETPEDSSFVTQGIPLEYVKAGDVANIVRNLMPKGTDIIVYEPSNMLIVTALPSGIIKLLKLLEAIDIPATERDSIRTFVYYVENAEATKLVSILKSIYAEKEPSAKQPAVQSVTPTPTPERRPTTRTSRRSARQAIAPQGEEGLAGEIEGEIVIEAYEDINALLIKTTPRGYITLLETLKKLDVQPKQVLIDVLIAEITLDDSMKLGVEWLLREEIITDGRAFSVLGGHISGGISIRSDDGDGNGGSTDIQASIPTSTFATILDPKRFAMLISAAASSDKINVLASPHIFGLDNQEAKIEIASEVPVATSLSQPQDITANTISQVEFKSVGIILTVTPYINEKKQVKLKISQEASQLGETVFIAGEEYQGFRTRKVTTTAVVEDKHTLVLGGIIETRSQKTRSGIPFLSSLPLVGYLFGTTTDVEERNELLILVTPHVVGSHEEADQLTREFQNRVRDIQKRIEEREKIKEDSAEVRQDKDL